MHPHSHTATCGNWRSTPTLRPLRRPLPPLTTTIQTRTQLTQQQEYSHRRETRARRRSTQPSPRHGDHKTKQHPRQRTHSLRPTTPPTHNKPTRHYQPGTQPRMRPPNTLSGDRRSTPPSRGDSSHPGHGTLSLGHRRSHPCKLHLKGNSSPRSHPTTSRPKSTNPRGTPPAPHPPARDAEPRSSPPGTANTKAVEPPAPGTKQKSFESRGGSNPRGCTTPDGGSTSSKDQPTHTNRTTTICHRHPAPQLAKAAANTR